MRYRTFAVVFGLAIALAVVFAAGLRVGAELGVKEFARMESSAKASLLTGELQLLRSGNGHQLIQTKEIELDWAIVQAISFQDSGKPWLFWPESELWNHERSLRRVAQYRVEHAPVVPGIAPPTEIQDPADLRGFGESVQRSIKVLVERYGR